MAAEGRSVVTKGFRKTFGKDPQWIVRCPGRVNLIGEHIDYNGYGVLPMAIEQSIFVAVARNDDLVFRFRNADERFESHDWAVDASWSGTTGPKWFEYFLSGWKGGVDWLKSSASLDYAESGLDLFIHGTIPPAAGLSSSSAMVCSATLTTWLVYSGRLFDRYTREDLVEVATRSERLVGLEGGGMDQAAVVLAQSGQALHIDFDPLQVRSVTLPESAMFAVLHSGVDANKAAHSHYNERVVECRIAAQVLTRLDSTSNDKPWSEIRRLRDFQDVSSLDLEQCTTRAQISLPSKAIDRSTAVKLLGTSDEQFVKLSLNNSTRDKQEFSLQDRSVHVFSEARRVHDFEQACMKGDVQQMGTLMNESHESCRAKYECSCAEMDALVVQCRKAGALGARLTGAGWGGCAVMLVHKDQVDQVKQQVDVLFWTRPSAGIEAWAA